MSSLVEKLSKRAQPVAVVIRPECTPIALKKCLSAGYINLKFPETQGGTTLHMSVDAARTSLNSANFEGGTGYVDLEASLTLDYTPLKCQARINLESMSGEGRLYAQQPA